jgi:hypothetical protein
MQMLSLFFSVPMFMGQKSLTKLQQQKVPIRGRSIHLHETSNHVKIKLTFKKKKIGKSNPA